MTRKRSLAPLSWAMFAAAAAGCSSGTPGPPAGPPAAPVEVVATAGIRSATLSWTAPQGNAGPADRYAVTASPAAPSATFTVSGTVAVVSGLANGTTYRFSVAAANAAGASAPSPLSAPVTTPDVPGAPTGLAATAGDRSATLSWIPPSSTGGAPVTGTTVVIAPTAPSAVVTVGAAGATISGLANGVAYTFRVFATNAVGDGAWSAPSGSVTPAVLVAIALTPAPLAVPRGGQRQLTVTGTYDAGPPRDVTAQARWTSSNPAVASVTGGLVTALATGTATVGATVGSASASVSVSVAPGVTSLAIFPPGPAFPLDRTLRIAAIATLEDGSSLVVTPEASWSSSSGSVRVAAGQLSAPPGASIGASALVGATYGGASAPAVTVTLLPASAAIGPGHDDDPFLPQQWHLHNTGQTAFAQNAGIAGNDIAAIATYAAGFGGRGVRVAVVDSGLEIAHEDLAANVVPGSWNFVNSTTDPTSSATDGDHGTSVAGLVAAVRANGKGGMGVAPMASLNGYNFMAGSQTTAAFTASMGAGTGGNGPDSSAAWVFNQSFGLSTVSPVIPSPTREAQYLDGVTNLRGGLGAVYVKSAGNGFQDYSAATSPDCTAANAAHVTCENASMDPYNTLPMNIVVGALDANGKRSSYSTAGAAVWVSAPGGEFGLSGSLTCGGSPCPPSYFDPAMISTDQSGCSAGYARTGAAGSPFDAGTLGNAQCNYTNTFNGTSSAAPVVSGVVALLLEANPSLTWRDVKHILASTARKVDGSLAPVTRTLTDGTYTVEPGWIMNGAGYWFHDWYGFGSVDADSAIAMATAYAPGTLPPMVAPGWITGTVPASNAIPDDSVMGAAGTITIPGSGAVHVEAVQVRVSTNHPAPRELGVELTSPGGTRSVLLNALSGFGANTAGTITFQLASNAFYGESSGGTWTLRVVDTSPGNTGRLAAWSMRLYGH